MLPDTGFGGFREAFPRRSVAAPAALKPQVDLPREFPQLPFGVDVQAPADAAAIVAFGDSITDGAISSPNTDRSWPSVLAQRLQANPATANIAIVNEGISGNRVLGDGAELALLPVLTAVFSPMRG